MSIPKTHDFWIRSQGAEWHWRASNGNDVAEYSGSLGRQVEKDREIGSSRVRLYAGVSEDALKIIISAIPSIPSNHDNGDPPALCVNIRDPEPSFLELLSLAIACWRYDCAIPPMCKKFTDEFYRQWVEPIGREPWPGIVGGPSGNAINWMFIAFVFHWDRIFTKNSQLVLSTYKMTDDDKLKLPEDFLARVAQTREQRVEETYRFVKDSWTSFYVPGASSDLMNRIHDHFRDKVGIELHAPLPEDTYREINPETLLTELDEAVQANEVRDPSLLCPPLVFDAPVQIPEPHTHGSGRSSLFGYVVVEVGRELVHALRKKMTSKVHETDSSSPDSRSNRQSWEKMQSLKGDINKFRERSLQGISLQDEEYAKLREKHIKTLTQDGFEPKIKRS